MTRWLLLASLLCAPVFGQQAYTWTDETGQVHYSDRPNPGAQEIELRTAQGFATRQPSAPQSPATEPAATAPQVQAYELFNVVQPAQQETLWNIGAMLNVEVDLAPQLQQGHHLGVYLDGELVDVGARAPQFQVPDVFRGLHTLQAIVLDASGQEVLRSLAVTFMVQQTSILNPNTPNANPRARAAPANPPRARAAPSGN
jgi:hypothetical protein